MDSPAICSVLRHPLSKGWGVFCDFFPYLPGVPAMYGILRHPSAKGWGVYGNFLPYLLGTPAMYGTLRHPSAKGWGVFGYFYPYLPQRRVPAPLSFRLQKFSRWPSNWPDVHRSAVFCTERSCECLAYGKRLVFCTARPCKGMPYSRKAFSVRREIRVQVRVEQWGNAITRLVKRCPVAFCGAGYRVKAVERLEPELRCG